MEAAHSLRWRGRGDIDSVAIAPTGIAFTIETKTRNYEPQHIARAREMAAWLRTRQRRWCCGGALPVLCVVRARQLEHIEADVLIVSLDRLPAALRSAAGARPRPTFLSPRGQVADLPMGELGGAQQDARVPRFARP